MSLHGRTSSFKQATLLLIVLSSQREHPEASPTSKAVPIVLEASYKTRLLHLLNTSAESAAAHLLKRLALGGGKWGGYELDLAAQDSPWRHHCSQVEPGRDSVENCILHQLQGLFALCDVESLLRSKAAKDLVRLHLKSLKQTSVDELGLKTSPTKHAKQGQLFLFRRKTGDRSWSDMDGTPAIQAAVLMAAVRCSDAIGDTTLLEELQSWFVGLQVYTQQMAKLAEASFHRAAMVWESLALVASRIRPGSDLHENLLEWLGTFEMQLRAAWQDGPSASRPWSFASARAIAIRFHSKDLAKKPKHRRLLADWAKEHADLFLGRGSSAGTGGLLSRLRENNYTCGPLQGLTSIASIDFNDAELLQVVMELIEKDIVLFQISELNQGLLTGRAKGRRLMQGSFFRDAWQLQREQRHSMRIDDTAQCLIAIMQAMKVLEGIEGIDMNQTAADQKAASGHESSEL